MALVLTRALVVLRLSLSLAFRLWRLTVITYIVPAYRTFRCEISHQVSDVWNMTIYASKLLSHVSVIALWRLTL